MQIAGVGIRVDVQDNNQGKQNLPPNATGTVNLTNLPKKFCDDAWQCVKWYAVAVVAEDNRVASGTLLQWDDQFGVLTAQHVTQALRTRPGATLLLSITDFPHRLAFRAQEVKFVDVGVPNEGDIGPDLSVLVLPPVPLLGELKARMSFFNISYETSAKQRAAQEDGGVWLVAGFPKAHVRTESARGGFSNAINTGLKGFGAGKVARYDRGGFDYVEIAMSTDWPDYEYDTFEGLSGGGVWRIPIYRAQQTGEFFFKDYVLAGVAFWQSEPKCGTRSLVCHGGRSIYENVLRALRNR